MAKQKKKGGRPRKYKTVEKLQAAIDKYFEEVDKFTICGLALHLGFVSRNSLLSYEGYSEEFFCTIKRAKTRIEQYYEEHLVENNAAGSIFALKNFDWSDKTDVVFEDKRTYTPEQCDSIRKLLAGRCINADS